MTEPRGQRRTTLPSAAPRHPLVTGRTVLRVMTDDDIDAVVTYRTRPNVYRWLSHGGLASAQLREKFQRRIERMTKPSDERSEVQFVVEREGHVIGDCGFAITRAWTKDDAPTPHLVARIHYALDDAVAGQGIGTEVVRALVDHAFSLPDVHRVQADVFAGNVASGRVLEKLRFRREGYFVDDGVIDGAFVDACLYSLLRREWEAPDHSA
ncbi:GNAT family N-acetyltransferase [Dermacoccus nishinomiyaensis]|uniref:GNAT family N-acetyltransferase n=1 Tax=Dermacoccus nishinomiyaensis TaxID=1274 RepID=UPI00289B0BCC|nr:GNAT family protein [Dermacoccus nishinomiyaensis]